MSDDKPETQTVYLTGVARTSWVGHARITVHDPLPEGHPMYALIGRVAAGWSQIEHNLDLLIWHMAGVDDRLGACLTSQIMGVAPRCGAIKLLASERKLSAEFVDDVNELLRRSYGVGDARNRIVHDTWYASRDDEAVSQFRSMPKGNPTYGMTEVTEEQVMETLAAISRLLERAFALRRRAVDELRA